MAVQMQGENRKQLWFMPPTIDDWVRPDDIVRFYVKTIESFNIPLYEFHINWRGTGDPMYEPHAMLTLVLFFISRGNFFISQNGKSVLGPCVDAVYHGECFSGPLDDFPFHQK